MAGEFQLKTGTRYKLKLYAKLHPIDAVAANVKKEEYTFNRSFNKAKRKAEKADDKRANAKLARYVHAHSTEGDGKVILFEEVDSRFCVYFKCEDYLSTQNCYDGFTQNKDTQTEDEWRNQSNKMRIHKDKPHRVIFFNRVVPNFKIFTDEIQEIDEQGCAVGGILKASVKLRL